MHSVRETSRQRERGTGAVQWRASVVKFVMAMQVMNAELDEVFQAMAIGAVPGLWKGKSFPSLKPLASYVDDLLRRLEMFSSWCAHLPPARAGSGVTAALLMGHPPPRRTPRHRRMLSVQCARHTWARAVPQICRCINTKPHDECSFQS